MTEAVNEPRLMSDADFKQIQDAHLALLEQLQVTTEQVVLNIKGLQIIKEILDREAQTLKDVRKLAKNYGIDLPLRREDAVDSTQ